jgi:hypothetical protein
MSNETETSDGVWPPRPTGLDPPFRVRHGVTIVTWDGRYLKLSTINLAEYVGLIVILRLAYVFPAFRGAADHVAGATGVRPVAQAAQFLDQNHEMFLITAQLAAVFACWCWVGFRRGRQLTVDTGEGGEFAGRMKNVDYAQAAIEVQHVLAAWHTVLVHRERDRVVGISWREDDARAIADAVSLRTGIPVQ